jgi:hypothetical protein
MKKKSRVGRRRYSFGPILTSQKQAIDCFE